jgi:hypothetical protein
MEEPTVSIIYPEDEDVWVLPNVGTHILNLAFSNVGAITSKEQ